MKVMMMFALGLVLVGSSTAALAKKHTMHATQAHHCEVKGTEVSKSKAACKKAGGRWAEGAPTAKAAAPTDAEPIK